MKPQNSGNLPVLKNVSIIENCSLLGGNVRKIVTFGTKHFVRYPMHVRYLGLGCPLLGGLTVEKNATGPNIIAQEDSVNSFL